MDDVKQNTEQSNSEIFFGLILKHSQVLLTAREIDSCLFSGTVEGIRLAMETAGLWDEFVMWHGQNLDKWYNRQMQMTKGRRIGMLWLKRDADADILTNPTLLIEACISFMEGRDAAPH